MAIKGVCFVTILNSERSSMFFYCIFFCDREGQVVSLPRLSATSFPGSLSRDPGNEVGLSLFKFLSDGGGGGGTERGHRQPFTR